MTGDVEECLLHIPQLEESVSSDANIPVTQTTSTAFINSNMTVEDTCLYTTALPADLAGSFSEGTTVLQIMPNSIVAVAMENLPISNACSTVFKDSTFTTESTQNTLCFRSLSNSNTNCVVFKNSTFPTERTQNTINLPNLLTHSTDNNESQSVDVAVSTEENMSDIDLSFLNETEETGSMTNKCLNESTVKELQGMIADVSSQSLNLLQNNLNLPVNNVNLSDNNIRPSQELEQDNSELPKDPDDPVDDMVMIDVTKPIQLSQNSLIMVNGQKCILQHDPQTGQVIAYPVKEQDKPRRRRGRPRKTSVEQVYRETDQNERSPAIETESFSEEEREKGLLEVVNDDGALVRRSSRKRKKAKVLRDYETGNLKQELGSDADDLEVLEKDPESFNRKKKPRGPGRPRKYAKAIENIPVVTMNNGSKRPRGRPRKSIPESEPSQAFLVQTADGQTLMMQVPLSSIPPGISLQEMAQEIANKLNLGLNQANGVSLSDLKDISSKELDSSSLEETMESISSEVIDSGPEPALQDHSIGSTTNFTSIQPQLSRTDENSEIVDSSCQDMINMNHIIGNEVYESEEVILESENSAKDVTSVIQESISDNQNNLNTLEMPQCSEENFCINMASTTTSSIDSTPIVCNLNEQLIDHNFYVTKSDVQETLKENFVHTETSENSKIAKELFIKNDILKDKVNFRLLLNTGTDIDSESQNTDFEQILKNLNPANPEGLILNVNKLKHFNIAYNAGLINQKSYMDKQYIDQQMPNIDCSNHSEKNVLESGETDIVNNENNVCDPSESVIDSVENTDIINHEYLSTVQSRDVDSAVKSHSQFIKPSVTNPENQAFEVILPLQKSSTSVESLPNDSVAPCSATTVIPVPEKVLPMLLPVQPLPGSKQCKICQMPYFTEEEIIEHFKSRHPKCICTECNYMNEHPYGIKRHAYRHTNQEIVCHICKKQYKDMYILKMHVKMVHLPPEFIFKCDTCEKQFTRKAHLKRHQRIHAPVKQYQCPNCDYKGCEKSDITKHLLIHEEPKFKCEICEKAFRHLKNKELHLKRHAGQRDYKCAACGFYGYTFTDIRKHIERRHSSVCPQCKQIFADVELLKQHKKIGLCQTKFLDEMGVAKIEECSTTPEENKEIALYNEVPLDFLDAEQPQIMTISECSEETLSALQNGQLIMTSVDGILNTHNGQLVVEGLEENNLLAPDGLSVISVDRDSNKMITLVTSNGRNLSLPLKNCSSLPLESVTTAETSMSEAFLLTNEAEAAS